MSGTIIIAVLMIIAALVLWQLWAILAVLKWLLIFVMLGLGIYFVRRVFRGKD